LGKKEFRLAGGGGGLLASSLERSGGASVDALSTVPPRGGTGGGRAGTKEDRRLGELAPTFIAAMQAANPFTFSTSLLDVDDVDGGGTERRGIGGGRAKDVAIVKSKNFYNPPYIIGRGVIISQT